MGGGIPLSEIEVYGRMAGIVNTLEFAQTIRLMDRIYLKATEKAAEVKKDEPVTAKAGAKGASGPIKVGILHSLSGTMAISET